MRRMSQLGTGLAYIFLFSEATTAYTGRAKCLAILLSKVAAMNQLNKSTIASSGGVRVPAAI
jgi:hypothetical protein